MSSNHIFTIPLAPDEQSAEHELLDWIARFWRSHANHSLRETFDRFVAATPSVPGVEFEESTSAGGRGWWVLPEKRSRPHESAILYLHGGCYVLGSAAAYCGFASQLAARAGTPVFVLEYPLAPEYPFPAAHEAALAAVRWLANLGVKQLAVAGDSAGGGLSLSALASMVMATDVPVLSAGVVLSPWTDLSLSGTSTTSPHVRDTLPTREFLGDSATKYLGGTAARDPVASPLFGIPAGLPPIYIQVGGDERLLDDATRYAVRARQQGIDVRIEVWSGLHHVFQLHVEQLASSRIALERVADFLNGYLHG